VAAGEDAVVIVVVAAAAFVVVVAVAFVGSVGLASVEVFVAVPKIVLVVAMVQMLRSLEAGV